MASGVAGVYRLVKIDGRALPLCSYGEAIISANRRLSSVAAIGPPVLLSISLHPCSVSKLNKLTGSSGEPMLWFVVEPYEERVDIAYVSQGRSSHSTHTHVHAHREKETHSPHIHIKHTEIQAHIFTHIPSGTHTQTFMPLTYKLHGHRFTQSHSHTLTPLLSSFPFSPQPFGTQPGVSGRGC